MVDYLVTFLENFAVVFVGMGLFMLPFCAVFAYRNREAILASRPHFNYFMEKFFVSRESNALVFTWAAAEAVVWYIIPEFLLFLLIFMKIHRKLDLVKYDFLGTIAGSLIGFLWQMPDQWFMRIPYVRPEMITQVHSWYQNQGILGLLHQPFSGVPYKVFIHEAAANFHFFIPLFLLLAVAARMIRYIVVYEATKAVYPLLHKFVRRHYAVLFVVACLVFTGLLVRVVQIYS